MSPHMDRARRDANDSLDSFTRELGNLEAYIVEELVQYERDREPSHLFAVIDALRDIMNQQMRPAAKMAEDVFLLSQTAPANVSSAAETIALPCAAQLDAIAQTPRCLQPHQTGAAKHRASIGTIPEEVRLAKTKSLEIQKDLHLMLETYNLLKQAVSESHAMTSSMAASIR